MKKRSHSTKNKRNSGRNVGLVDRTRTLGSLVDKIKNALLFPPLRKQKIDMYFLVVIPPSKEVWKRTNVGRLVNGGMKFAPTR